MSLDPTRAEEHRWVMRWKPALNAFEVAFEMTFDGRRAAGHGGPTNSSYTIA